MPTNIELSKTRDFGEIIGDTFMFIRENFSPLLKCFFVFCGFFMVASFVVNYLEQMKLIGAMNDITADPDSYNTDTNPLTGVSKLLGIPYLLALLFQFLTEGIIVVTVISYMAVYKVKGNLAPTVEEVWGYVKYYYFKSLGCLFIVAILFIIGFVCCIIPGIWLYPVLSLIFPIMIIENTGFGFAFSQSFRLIKENWWATFGALFVAGLIGGILKMVILLPVGAANIGTMFLHKGRGMHLSPTLTLISTALTELCHVFSILPMVALTLCYFNLTESTDAPGLMDRINQLGNNDEHNTNSPTEEY